MTETELTKACEGIEPRRRLTLRYKTMNRVRTVFGSFVSAENGTLVVRTADGRRLELAPYRVVAVTN